MANVHSAIKQIRKASKRRLVNQAALSELKTLWRKMSSLSKNDKEAQALAKKLTSKWDRAVSRGIVPRGRADRKKARIAHFLAKLGQEK